MLPRLFDKPTQVLWPDVKSRFRLMCGKEIVSIEEIECDPYSQNRALLFNFTDGTFERVLINSGFHSPTVDEYIKIVREKIYECLTKKLPYNDRRVREVYGDI